MFLKRLVVVLGGIGLSIALTGCGEAMILKYNDEEYNVYDLEEKLSDELESQNPQYEDLDVSITEETD